MSTIVTQNIKDLIGNKNDFMELNNNQLEKLISVFKSHVNGSAEDKVKAEKIMSKYGCKSAPEAYRLIKENK